MYGWIRETERELCMDSIPKGIISIVILYYRDDEMFEVIGDGVVTALNNRLIKRIGADNKEIPNYGKMEADSNGNSIYEWHLKIHKYGKWMDIGISTWITDEANKWLSKPGEYYYGVYTNHSRDKVGRVRTCDGTFNYEYLSFNSINDGDTLKLEYNANSAKLRCSINDSDFQLVWDQLMRKENIKYRLMVILTRKDESVEIISFKKSVE